MSQVANKHLGKKLDEQSEELEHTQHQIQLLELQIELLNQKYHEHGPWIFQNIIDKRKDDNNDTQYKVEWLLEGWVTEQQLVDEGYQDIINDFEKEFAADADENDNEKQNIDVAHVKSKTFHFLAANLKHLAFD